MPESTRTLNRWTPTRKAAVILELLRGGEAGELARTHGLSQTQRFVWRDRFLGGAGGAQDPPRTARTRAGSPGAGAGAQGGPAHPGE
jgi:transposase-like protein